MYFFAAMFFFMLFLNALAKVRGVNTLIQVKECLCLASLFADYGTSEPRQHQAWPVEYVEQRKKIKQLFNFI